jgi:hypothetical protein
MQPFSTRCPAAVALAIGMTLTLAACGGGDGEATPPPAAPVAPHQINAANYLDAFWIGAFGVSRAADALMLIDNAMAQILRPLAPGTPPAPPGNPAYYCEPDRQGLRGTLTLTQAGTVRTLTFANCLLGDAVYVSGSISSPNATALTLDGVQFLGSGRFTLTALVYRRAAGGDGVPQTVDGALGFRRDADRRTVQLEGGFSVTRNGRADMYASLLANFAPRDVPVAPTVNTGSFSVSTPRFTAAPLTVSGNATGLTLVAPDGTRLVGRADAQGSLASVTYELTPPHAGTPALLQTLATNDGQVQAAIARVLQ